MLIGSYSSNLSLKRRIAVPKKFLKELGTELVVAKWYEGCLVLVGKSTWEALLKRLTGKTEIVTQPVRDTDRFILGSAYEFRVDGQGRIVIPTSLVNYANLGQRIIFVGLGDRVEVWDEKLWLAKEKEIAEHASEQIERMASEKR